MTYPGNPLEYDFGTLFNYAAWTENTTIDLVNVPWNNDYRDVVKFANRAALDSYIDGRRPQGVRIDNLSYVKPNTPIRINVPFNGVYKYNYLRASNPVQPVPGDIVRNYYYFITDVRYIAPNTTEIIVQLDVFQTFIFDATFGNSFVQRGHLGIANEKQFDSFGRDYLTIPEGLDTGAEYVTVTKRDERIMTKLYETDEDSMMVLGISTVDLIGSGGTVSDPLLLSATGSRVQGIGSGATFYVWGSIQSFRNWLINKKDKPWVTQGIISLTLIPPIGRYIPGYERPLTMNPYEIGATQFNILRYGLFANWRSHADVVNYIPTRYRHLKKLLTAPYCMVELTTWAATPILIRPETWNDPNGTIIERISLLPPNQRVMFHPFKLNARTGSATERRNGGNGVEPIPASELGGDDYGDYLDVSTQIGNLPQIPIVNNGGIAYLAGNAHSLSFQQQGADWAQQRALGGAAAAYDNANTGIDANKISSLISQGQAYSLNAIANNQMASTAGLNLAGGALGAAGSGGPAGVAAAGGSSVLGLLGSAAAQTAMNAANNVNAGSMNSQMENQNRAAGDVRDTNNDLATWAAKGDYQNAIAGINAKVQDSKMIPPSVSGQMGGEAMNLITDNMKVSMRVKMLDQANIRMVGEYWLRYGYAVHKFTVIPASLMVMTKFTYWKLAETYITTATMPETFKQALRGIFEKGVTVWANPADIGVIDIADNAPLEGISY